MIYIDQIPVLQIDVNLKNGVKKKVFVFEGDTAEQLAENFAIENSILNILFIFSV